jgi:5-formyltetrahydrofolate cyclo-ligase
MDRVLALPELKAARVIHIFSAMESQREPGTGTLIERLMAQGKQVVVPVMQWEQRQLYHVALSAETPLIPNKWGIPEPPLPSEHKKSVSGAAGTSKLIAPETLDLVLVPLLAGDVAGNRLGYGKGFYDRFLHQLRPDASCFGMLYEAGLFDEIPVEPHDRPLDGFITEKRTLRTV